MRIIYQRAPACNPKRTYRTDKQRRLAKYARRVAALEFREARRRSRWGRA